MEKKWRFELDANCIETGLEVGDMDTFKKDPIGSLAREICQNSIDAKDVNVEGPTKVVFRTFFINRNEIPGIDRLTEQIRKCYEYGKDDPKEGAQLFQMKEAIEGENILCLRISDFNTTGLIGVNTFKRKSPFFSLTRTVGFSSKRDGSGGSKGLGKAAAFVGCTLRTVFYSTNTNEGETGYLGVSKLRSVPVPENGPLAMTTAEGYYGKDKESLPITGEQLFLDKDFKRDESQSGTDLYLLGFKNWEKWREDLILKILDSFMVALVKGKLIVEVEGIVLEKDTVSDIINNPEIKLDRSGDIFKSVRAQYEILSSSEIEPIKKISWDLGVSKSLLKAIL